tara:strand:- start:1580 stop:1690 length:111 start_codon:yes stop_codon:yes gene_type:complete
MMRVDFGYAKNALAKVSLLGGQVVLVKLLSLERVNF